MWLRIFSNHEKIFPELEDLISQNFDVKIFDITIPHSLEEWQSYFFTTNPEAREAEECLQAFPFYRVQLHSSAFACYIKKKIEKGLVTGS